MKNKIAYFLIVGSFLIVFLLFVLNKHSQEIIPDWNEFNKDFDREDILTYELSESDRDLFLPQFRSQLKVLEISNSKRRPPVVSMILDGKYQIIKYIFDGQNINSLKNCVEILQKSTEVSIGYSCRLLDRNYFEFRYRTSNNIIPDSLFFSISADSFNLKIRNDSMLFCTSLCNNFSIKYQKDDPIDIYLNGKSRVLKNAFQIPMNIMFLKREGKIYLLVLAPLNNAASIPEDLLFKTVKL